jgi:hypothetical protein
MYRWIQQEMLEGSLSQKRNKNSNIKFPNMAHPSISSAGGGLFCGIKHRNPDLIYRQRALQICWGFTTLDGAERTTNGVAPLA